MAHQVFSVLGTSPLLDIAIELERIALSDEYFVSRKLYPNVDFYSGLIYQAMKFPMEMFPVLFAIPRTVGWLAQWDEMLRDPEQKIARPRQVYTGSATAASSRTGWSARPGHLAGWGAAPRPACSRSSVFSASRQPPASSPQPPALSLPDRHHLPRLHRAGGGVSAVRPAHVDLVDQSRSCPSPKCARGSCVLRNESPAATSRNCVRPPALMVMRVPIGFGSPLLPSVATVSHAPAAPVLWSRLGGAIEVRDQQIELAVVVVVADRQPAARPPLRETGSGLGRSRRGTSAPRPVHGSRASRFRCA